MAWAAITEADLVTRISSTELEAYRSVVLAAGQVDPVAPAIAQVTELVRGYVEACAKNELGAAGTIPPKLLGPALDLLVVEVIKRVPGQELDEARTDAKKDAIKLLEQVAACKFSIEDPDTGEGAGGNIEVANKTTRQTTRSQMEGL